jgi:hypothetical protein
LLAITTRLTLPQQATLRDAGGALMTATIWPLNSAGKSLEICQRFSVQSV